MIANNGEDGGKILCIELEGIRLAAKRSISHHHSTSPPPLHVMVIYAFSFNWFIPIWIYFIYVYIWLVLTSPTALYDNLLNHAHTSNTQPHTISSRKLLSGSSASILNPDGLRSANVISVSFRMWSGVKIIQIEFISISPSSLLQVLGIYMCVMWKSENRKMRKNTEIGKKKRNSGTREEKEKE